MKNINNKNDIEEMMQYHRTKDMINLLTYFPELSPIRNLTIVKDIDDYYNNYEFCKSLPCERNDTLITKPVMPSVEATGLHANIEAIFKRVKELDKDGVMVLFDLCHEPSDRYKRYAGIAVGVSIGKGCYIDAVSKGFDGREVSKGISTHEQYFIPWYDLRKCCIENFKQYRTYLISDDEYTISRNNRISFLTSIGIPLEESIKYVPEKYQEIPDFIWLDVIKNLLKKLENMEDELMSAKLDEFAISGHTEGKRYLPWQIFDKSRYLKK